MLFKLAKFNLISFRETPNWPQNKYSLIEFILKPKNELYKKIRKKTKYK